MDLNFPKFNGLVLPSPSERRELHAALPVCETFEGKDLDGWEALLTPENDPSTFLRFERQARNDCQPHDITGCLETIEHRLNGPLKGQQLSRAYAYNQCEQISGFRLGGNVGTTIQSGVKLATESGIPTETAYPYAQYTNNTWQFTQWEAAVANQPRAKVAKGTLAPAWKTALPGTALGHPITIGIQWPLLQPSGTVRGKKVYDCYSRNHGDGGHAVFGAFPYRMSNGRWLLMVVNSHGDEYFFITEQFYEQARASSPYGMYQLYGVENPVQAFYDGKVSLLTGLPHASTPSRS